MVARGELVEIGAFLHFGGRDARAGCVLHEVGTTNRHPRKDYRQAVNDNTGLLDEGAYQQLQRLRASRKRSMKRSWP